MVNLTGEDLRRRLLELHESLLGQVADPVDVDVSLSGRLSRLATFIHANISNSLKEDSKPNVALIVDGISLEGYTHTYMHKFLLGFSYIHSYYYPTLTLIKLVP